MTLSAETRAALDRLSASAARLLVALSAQVVPGRPGAEGALTAIANVRRYRDLLDTGHTAAALRGANLLTTVAKGIADAIANAGPALEQQAIAVTRDAIDAARRLREDGTVAG